MLALLLTAALHLDQVPTPEDPVLQELTVVAPEPRFVAPTRRDRIRRIWPDFDTAWIRGGDFH